MEEKDGKPVVIDSGGKKYNYNYVSLFFKEKYEDQMGDSLSNVFAQGYSVADILQWANENSLEMKSSQAVYSGVRILVEEGILQSAASRGKFVVVGQDGIMDVNVVARMNELCEKKRARKRRGRKAKPTVAVDESGVSGKESEESEGEGKKKLKKAAPKKKAPKKKKKAPKKKAKKRTAKTKKGSRGQRTLLTARKSCGTTSRNKSGQNASALLQEVQGRNDRTYVYQMVGVFFKERYLESEGKVEARIFATCKESGGYGIPDILEWGKNFNVEFASSQAVYSGIRLLKTEGIIEPARTNSRGNYVLVAKDGKLDAETLGKLDGLINQKRPSKSKGGEGKKKRKTKAEPKKRKKRKRNVKNKDEKEFETEPEKKKRKKTDPEDMESEYEEDPDAEWVPGDDLPGEFGPGSSEEEEIAELV